MVGIVKALLIGKVQTYGDENAANSINKIWQSAIFKVATKDEIYADKFGFNGDEVADKKHHGGAEKAIFANSYENYPVWSEFLGLNNGGKIWQDDESEQYLKSRKAAAMNLGADLIVLQKRATISEILEELYHAEQWRDGRLVDNPLSKIKAEIEAQNYLLSVKKRYNIPRSETEQTKQNLEYWKGELKKYEN